MTAAQPPPGMRAWLRKEAKRRRDFEAHVKEQLGYVKTAIDWILKAMEVEEKHHDSLEKEQRRV